MSNDIQITRVSSDPPHYRAVYDGGREAWSITGSQWISIMDGTDVSISVLRRAFHAQILAPTTPEQPKRAKVGQWIKVGGESKSEVVRVSEDGVFLSDSFGVKHGHYIIVDPPNPPTATGDKITERDGVWESGDIRVRVQGGKIELVLARHGHPNKVGGSWFSELHPAMVDEVFTLIFTDPADLTKGWKGGE